MSSRSFPTRTAFHRLAHVNGTALATDGTTLLVFVTKKVAADDLDPDDLVPPTVTVDGTDYDTDVIPVGIPHSRTAPAQPTTTDPADHRARHRPVVGGVSVGNSATGTVGSPLLETEDGEPVALTNAHVAAHDSVLYQPAPRDGGRYVDDADAVGEVISVAPLDPTGVNTTDSALMSVDPERTARSVLGIGELVGFDQASMAGPTEYTKAGRTSGVTTGELTGTDAILDIAYGPDTLRFEGLDVYGPMSEPGDSGSLIGYTTVDGFVCTSLLFAGSERITLGIPISAVEAYHGPLSLPMDDPDTDPDPDPDPEPTPDPDEPADDVDDRTDADVDLFLTVSIALLERLLAVLREVDERR